MGKSLKFVVDQSKYFEGLGFEQVKLGDKILYKSATGTYYRLDVSNNFLAIEYADDYEDAPWGRFDDVDLFDLPKDAGDNPLLGRVREAIKEYCD